ncbi:MAG: SGNH/GDSL hydrolase family protein [Myxococcota bacterium]
MRNRATPEARSSGNARDPPLLRIFQGMVRPAEIRHLWGMNKWQWILASALTLIAVLAVAGALALRNYGQKSLDPQFYDDTIAEFEAADQKNPPLPGAILFTGSSSIRLWDTLAEDMAPLRVINRGFGGAHMAHVARNAKRLTLPYAPTAIVVYAGDNDLAEGTGKSPETVIQDFQTFLSAVRSELPDVPIYFIAIKPSVLRWDRWPEMQEANEGIRAMAAADDRLHFLDIATPMLISSDPEASPVPSGDLFRFDGLHLSAAGYAVWTEAIRPILLAHHGKN